MTTYFTSDLHYNHANIIKYASRPFNSVEEMNEALIKNWNNTVGKNDAVYFLGDLCFCNSQDLIELVQKLNGYKNIILGNHDNHSIPTYQKAGFRSISKHPVIINNNIILSHEPVALRGDFYNIHGHLHGLDTNKIIEKNPNRYFNVCVEKTNFKPVTFKHVYKKLLEKSDKTAKYLLTSKELLSLLTKSSQLELLEVAGVDNWNGYEYAYQLLREEGYEDYEFLAQSKMDNMNKIWQNVNFVV